MKRRTKREFRSVRDLFPSGPHEDATTGEELTRGTPICFRPRCNRPVQLGKTQVIYPYFCSPKCARAFAVSILAKEKTEWCMACQHFMPSHDKLYLICGHWKRDRRMEEPFWPDPHAPVINVPWTELPWVKEMGKEVLLGLEKRSRKSMLRELKRSARAPLPESD